MVAIRSKEIDEDDLYKLMFGNDWRLIKESHGKTSIIRQLFSKMNSGRFEVELDNEGCYVIDIKGYGFKLEKELFEDWYLVV